MLRIAFLNSILVSVNRSRRRALWMYPLSFTWFEMVDREYDEKLWYSNFRVTRETFEFLLNEVMEYKYAAKIHSCALQLQRNDDWPLHYTSWYPLLITEL